jgi:hypothetical protein
MFKDNIRCALTASAAALAINMPLRAWADGDATSSGPGANSAILHKSLTTRRAFADSAMRTVSSHHAATLNASGTTAPADVYANPDAAYPPSCLVDGLHASQYAYTTDPQAQRVQVVTPIYDFNTGYYDLSETDTYTVWRVPCSGGVSAVLLELNRPAGMSGTTSQYPTFPDIYTGTSSSVVYVRLPNDPNTVYSDTILGSPVIEDAIYVFEYYSGAASSASVNYNQAFTLIIDTLTQNASGNEITATINVPAYSAANFNSYPSASSPMEISGYMSTNWFDPAHGGEGMLIQVYDNGDQETRTFTAAWYTFDPAGLPFWLFAQGTVAIGATQATNVPTYYSTNGGFAGNFGASSTFTQWGTMSFSFPDCNTMKVSYDGKTDAQTNGPGGQGSLSWSRLANINSLNCD